ncbi:DUF58 domain-containing protein [Cryobacterium sp. W22_MBD10_FK3]|uniref:DUF58 domain-containing protein n=1 Tax=Cryobacterium sp. W22_MBD10_FK3 TaxID=3240273 RepID=UPI003F8E1717
MTLRTESHTSRTSHTSTSTSTSTSTVSATHTRYASGRAGSLVEVVVWWLRAWRTLTAAIRATLRWVGETVTTAGWVAVFAVIVLLPTGLIFGWTELILAGVVGAALIMIALPFLTGGRAYSVDFTLPVERVVAGSEVTGALRVTNIAKRLELPGRIDVPIGAGLTEVYVPLMRPRQVHEEAVVVPAYHRGVIDVGPITTVRSDPLGVLKREVAWASINRLYVHPITVSIPSTSAGFVRDLEGNPTSDIVDSDISFHAIREYAPGDGQRNIHWKSTAKTGKLMVRQFEESRRSRLAIILSLDTAEYGSDEEFEMAVSVVGSLGVRAVRDGRDLAVVVSEEMPDIVSTRMRSVRSLNVISSRTLLDDLTTVGSSPRMMAIEEVCVLAAQVIPDISIAFVACGSAITPARIQALRLKFPANVSIVAVLCDPQSPPSYRDLSGTGVLTIGILDDLRSLLARKAA